ncbi:MAG: phosphatase PAP2 family protein, partial [Planctomycetales bacterium]|nr:phosphatase PAP2 family protein [Planctomycetales bacterium]
MPRDYSRAERGGRVSILAMAPPPPDAALLEVSRPPRRALGPSGRFWLPRVATLASMLALFGGGFYALAAWNEARHAAGVTFVGLSTPLDEAIPLFAPAVWGYLLFYPVAFLPVLLLGPRGDFRAVARATLLLLVVSFACYALIPVRVVPPAVPGSGASADVLRAIHAVDHGYNAIPSLHVSHAVLVALLFRRLRPGSEGLLLLAAAVVAASCVLVKQHYAADVVAGALLGWGVARAALGPVPGPRVETSP